MFEMNVSRTARQFLVVCGAMLISPALVGTNYALGAESGIDKSDFDTSVRPQDDFFMYVNGGWIARTEIPADKSSYGAFNILREGAENNLQAILDDLAAKNRHENADDKMLADYYSSFMDVDAIEGLGIKPIEEDLARITAIQTKEQLLREMTRLRRTGVSMPVAMYAAPDPDDSSHYIAFLTQSGLGLPNREYYLLDGEKYVGIRDSYRAYARQLYDLAGIEGGGKMASVALAMETRIAEIQWRLTDAQDPIKTKHKMAPSALHEMSPQIPWDLVMEGLGYGNLDVLNVDEDTYMVALGVFFDETSVGDWKAYLTLRYLSVAAPHLSSNFVDTNFEFYGRVLGGLAENSDRWRRGVRSTNGAMGWALGKTYVARYFPPEAKARMDGLVINLISAMHEAIDELPWMGDVTKKASHEKLSKFTPYIGYPDDGKWRTYDGLEIVPGDYFGNRLAANSFNYDYQRNRVGQPVDRDEWGMYPQMVNAGYWPSQNKISFPAAILQAPFFNLAADDAVNYGAIGVVIGHEVTHGFDDDGRRYDGDGNLRDWWTEEDNKRFVARTQKLIDQFDAFEALPGLNVKGEQTLGENIGDLSGLAIAFKAYRKSLNGREAPVIDGLTGDQRFFIGYAQIWRKKMRDEYLRMIVLSDEHAPGPFRVSGPLSNISEFYKAFDVQEGDDMYRPTDERVKVW